MVGVVAGEGIRSSGVKPTARDDASRGRGATAARNQAEVEDLGGGRPATRLAHECGAAGVDADAECADRGCAAAAEGAEPLRAVGRRTST